MLHELANEDGDLGQSLRGLSESRCQVSLKSSSAIRAFGAAPLRVGFVCEGVLAEREGFEPTVVLPTHAFQACALNHSAISPPKRRKLLHLPAPRQQFCHSTRRSASARGRVSPHFRIPAGCPDRIRRANDPNRSCRGVGEAVVVAAVSFRLRRVSSGRAGCRLGWRRGRSSGRGSIRRWQRRRSE
jgi:hypothetical protein